MLVVLQEPLIQLIYELLSIYEYRYARPIPITYDTVPDKTTVTLPLYGAIELNKPTLYLMSLPIVERLSRIKQLALTELIYIGATHTRLEHSIGVAHLMKVLCTLISYLSKRQGIEFQVTNFDEVTLSIIGLLHDIGHPGWGHALDGIVGNVVSKLIELGIIARNPLFAPKKLDMAIAQYLLENNDQMKIAIEHIGKREIQKECPELKVEPTTYRQLIAVVIAEEKRWEFFKELHREAIEKPKLKARILLYTDLLAEPINCDRLDWIIRDELHAMLSTILPEDQKQKLNEIKATINKLIEIAEEVSKRAQLKEDKVKTVEQILKIAENIESKSPKQN